ncbi:Outer membrane protein assembly factor BamB, contains PQQ-like beta-propeller repeat [Haladaptatus litoreus]|uniref:Outer membrane protein assembly factor BamB, contains PQQ-like beta-propeller repeat n=1 Tax=Haladaptatus litoreus TaxID=553468 RepID=A0A1N7E7A8_9EURY|nr:PQQ-binding-like beta-propeller repeat protein [Haladaptatus litoreus]SIR83967.1 Outer membrane protein assembly factor BamB, contains PQQ-like beta-propeller repeat [Haladaptatus litoreus]
MRFATGAVLLIIVAVLAGVGVVAFTGDDGGTLSERWVSDTGRDMKGNHHAPAAATIGNQSFVFAPISDRGNGTGCGLFALNGETGDTVWKYQVPPANCTIHAVADPTVSDFDGDGTQEVLAASTEERVTAYDVLSGDEEMRHELDEYGYTKPVVANLTADSEPETAVVDVQGQLSLVRTNGTELWSRDLGGMVWARPMADDFDADGSNELAVGVTPGGGSHVRLLDGNNETVWKNDDITGSVLWMGYGQADDDPAIEISVATSDGEIVVLDGADGSVEWRRSVGDLAAVHDITDGDGDGTPEVYAVSREGTLFALDATDGSVEWETSLTTETQMTPPPIVGDVDGDDETEIVAATNDGKVTVVAPDSGNVLATYERSVPIYTHPALADFDGDGAEEIYVIYGDGRVVSLSYES